MKSIGVNGERDRKTKNNNWGGKRKKCVQLRDCESDQEHLCMYYEF